MFEYTTDPADGPAPEILQSLDELAREGARRMIEGVRRLEVDAYIERLRGERDERGCALVVRSARPCGNGASRPWARCRRPPPAPTIPSRPSPSTWWRARYVAPRDS